MIKRSVRLWHAGPSRARERIRSPMQLGCPSRLWLESLRLVWTYACICVCAYCVWDLRWVGGWGVGWRRSWPGGRCSYRSTLVLALYARVSDSKCALRARVDTKIVSCTCPWLREQLSQPSHSRRTTVGRPKRRHYPVGAKGGSCRIRLVRCKSVRKRKKRKINTTSEGGGPSSSVAARKPVLRDQQFPGILTH